MAFVRKLRNLLSGFAAKNRGVLRSRSRNEFEAAFERAEKAEQDNATRIRELQKPPNDSKGERK